MTIEPCEYGYYHQIGCPHHKIPRERAQAPEWAMKLAKALSIQFGAETTGHQRDETYRNIARAFVAVREDEQEASREHVRALLADDEATIEAIAIAIYQQPWRTPFAELPGNTREYWRRYARAAVAAIRRKALEE